LHIWRSSIISIVDRGRFNKIYTKIAVLIASTIVALAITSFILACPYGVGLAVPITLFIGSDLAAK